MRVGYTRPNATLASPDSGMPPGEYKDGAAAAGISGICGVLNSGGIVCVIRVCGSMMTARVVRESDYHSRATLEGISESEET
jgi:hypothetical protein